MGTTVMSVKNELLEELEKVSPEKPKEKRMVALNRARDLIESMINLDEMNRY